MGFLLRCPNCGERNVYEFTFGGEFRQRPLQTAGKEEWTRYLYLRRNEAGAQKEWWNHRYGCRKWFLAIRDTKTNTVLETFWPENQKNSETS